MGKYVLCYNWRYNDKESFLPFKYIKVAALQFSGVAVAENNGNVVQLGGISPLYSHPSRKIQFIPTSLGCVARAYISGQGFGLLGDDTPIMCNYDSRSSDPANSVPSILATFTDEHLICAIPELPFLGEFGFHVSLGLAGSPRNITFNDIQTYDARTVRITSISPAGSGYNLPVRVELRGTGLIALDDEKCVLGPSVTPPWTNKRYDSVFSKVYNSSYAVCDFDPIPDDERDQLGELELEWYSNGQCPTTTNVTFHMWNALVSGATPLGAPSSTPLDVYITGSGFSVPTSYGHATCRFSQIGASRRRLLSAPREQAAIAPTTDQLAPAPHARRLQSTTSYSRPAQILSEALILCSMPNISHVGEWSLELLLNGQTAEPVLHDGAADTPIFTIYNLSEVHVTSIVPPGAPVCNIAATARVGCQPIGVIVYGAGFADYGGAGSLVCVIDGMPEPATLLDSGRVLCDMPPMSSPRTVAVTVSLNNATSGTLPTDSVSFAYYQVPTLLTLMPTSGNAMGGTPVTISGYGGHFEGLSTDNMTRLQYLRIKFGDVIQSQPVLSLTPHELVVEAPWGQAGEAFVTLALNGISFAVTGTKLGFTYFGLHAVQLIDVYFPVTATRLVIQFDAQPTNKANMNGQQPCATVLSYATVQVLRGSSDAAPLCAWTDDSTLVAFLTKFTDAGPGMSVEVLPDKIWPSAWAYNGSCNVAESLCARSNLTLTIDADFPCDLRATTSTRELCATPFVTVQAPNAVGSCLETPLELDGSDYSGAGIKPLTFLWAAHPTQCDDYYALQAQIEPQRSSDRVELSVNTGSSFLFTLTITNFLGSIYRTTVTVARRSMPTPTVTITSPSVLEVAPRRLLPWVPVPFSHACFGPCTIPFRPLTGARNGAHVHRGHRPLAAVRGRLRGAH